MISFDILKYGLAFLLGAFAATALQPQIAEPVEMSVVSDSLRPRARPSPKPSASVEMTT